MHVFQILITFVFLLFVFRIDPGTTSSEDILERFIKSGLHPDGSKKETWPKETTVVCLIDNLDNSQKIVIQHNIPKDKHAEVVLVEYIKEELDPKEIKSITLYINYSPCFDCSVKLKKLKEDFPDLEIIFSAFYFIKRPSCTFPCGCYTKEPNPFRMLTELGALPFQTKDWDDLIKLLMKNDEQEGHPTSDLHKLRYGDEYKDWRNGEDEKMMEDYNELNTPSPSGDDLADSLQRVSLGDWVSMYYGKGIN